MFKAETLPRKSTLYLILVLSIILLSGYWYYRSCFPTTDNAYLHANIIPIASQVTGRVTKIYFQDNQFVKKGDTLFDIDPRPFLLAVEKAKANLQLAQQQIAALSHAVNSAKAGVDKSNALAAVNQKNSERVLSLLAHDRISKADGDEAKSKLLESQANLNAATNEYQRLVKLLGNPGNDNAQIHLAEIELQQAQLNLQYTHVISPADGQVTQFNLRNGSIVNENQPLFSLVESGQWWINANFKETTLKNIQPKQKVTITIDMYPGLKLRGEVTSIGVGSESAFSLFPAENATGNWVKVTQRIPVRIHILDHDQRYPLRIGASAEVTINTWSSG